MAHASNLAAVFVSLLMVILAMLMTCEARPVQESAGAGILIPGISTASQATAVIRHNTKGINLRACSSSSISITNHAASAPGSITFKVMIINVCDCPASTLLLNCGNFASATLVSPQDLKRLGDGTCLVNNGQAIAHGQDIHFQYQQSFKQPLSFRSASFGCSTSSIYQV